MLVYSNVMHLSVCASTGIALLYLHLHGVFRHSSFLQKAQQYVEHSLRCLTRRHDVTFLCGDAGPLAIAAVVYYRLQRAQEADECINRSGQMFASENMSFLVKILRHFLLFPLLIFTPHVCFHMFIKK